MRSPWPPRKAASRNVEYGPADGKHCRRIAPVEVIKRKLGRGSFDLGIFDECHELKGPTAQGTTHGILMGCRRTISMTGSIASGYADEGALSCGPGRATGQALLVVKEGAKLSGMLLGGRDPSLDGRRVGAGMPDFEFVREGRRVRTAGICPPSTR